MKSGPVILVDDDEDDKNILEEVYREMGYMNKLHWFSNGVDAYKYLMETKEQPFIIISDVNLPGMNGVEFKKKIDNTPYLRQKSIPFIFYSTYVDPKVVTIAYTEMTVQGFFQKKNSLEEVRKDIGRIVEYWMNCKHPNSDR